MKIPLINAETVTNLLDYPVLIKSLELAFSTMDIVTPPRQHHDYQSMKNEENGTLLLMPSWDPYKKLGVKLVTVTPHNSKYSRQAVNGIYILFNIETGAPEVLIDAKELTNRRTAAASALASKYLSNKKPNC